MFLDERVTASRGRLEDLLSAPVPGFAYPYGSMDEAARYAVGSAGYQYACAVETPLAHLGPLALPRIGTMYGVGAVHLGVAALPEQPGGDARRAVEGGIGAYEQHRHGL